VKLVLDKTPAYNSNITQFVIATILSQLYLKYLFFDTNMMEVGGGLYNLVILLPG